jgi:glycosyltransferase involved in cell wall biosynthesis
MLFFGEIPPKTLHGASLSSFINLKMLSSIYKIEIIEEYSNLIEHNSFSISKVYLFSAGYFLFLKSVFKSRFCCFYGVFYLSTFGVLKNLLVILTFKFFNPGSAVILHFHRSDFNLFLSNKVNKLFFKILDLFVDRYIVLSELHKLDVSKNVELEKLRVLYNTIEEEISFSELISSSSKSENVFHISFVSNFIKEKGIIELINAIKILNFNSTIKYKLDLHGNYSSNLLKEVICSLADKDDNIQILPPIIGIDKYNKIYNSDLLVLPSYNEGVPLILLECMYLGTPIVITSVGYIAEILGDNYPLYCKPKDVDSIVSSILKCVDLSKSNFSKNYNYVKFSHNSHKLALFDIFNI